MKYGDKRFPVYIFEQFFQIIGNSFYEPIKLNKALPTSTPESNRSFQRQISLSEASPPPNKKNPVDNRTWAFLFSLLFVNYVLPLRFAFGCLILRLRTLKSIWKKNEGILRAKMDFVISPIEERETLCYIDLTVWIYLDQRWKNRG